MMFKNPQIPIFCYNIVFICFQVLLTVRRAQRVVNKQQWPTKPAVKASDKTQ